VGKGLGGNREVSPVFLLGARADFSGAGAEAISKEGGSWGKHGFPHGSEPQDDLLELAAGGIEDLALAQEEAVAAARV
jgi:hypothetical protein